MKRVIHLLDIKKVMTIWEKTKTKQNANTSKVTDDKNAKSSVVSIVLFFLRQNNVEKDIFWVFFSQKTTRLIINIFIEKSLKSFIEIKKLITSWRHWNHERFLPEISFESEEAQAADGDGESLVGGQFIYILSPRPSHRVHLTEKDRKRTKLKFK